MSVASDAGLGVDERILPTSELKLERYEPVMESRLGSPAVGLELGVITSEIIDPMVDVVIVSEYELGWNGVEILSVPPVAVAEESEDDGITPDGVTLASTVVEPDLSDKYCVEAPVVNTVLSSVPGEVDSGLVLMDAPAVGIVLDSGSTLPAEVDVKDRVSIYCIVDDVDVAAGDVGIGSDLSSSELTLAKVDELLPIDSRGGGSSLVNVPASCKELDAVKSAELPPALSSFVLVTASFVEEAMAVDNVPLGDSFTETGLSVGPSVTGDPDEDPAKTMIDEGFELTVSSAAPLADSVSDPDISPRELRVEVATGNEELIEVMGVSVRASTELDVLMGSETSSVLELSGPPSTVDWPSKLLSAALEAPFPVGLGDEAG
ncbi:hypothetical protein PG997_001292 [Apiospora hydei]|uniref:Uncharacterized protein n=1 Tax=Apiospora hydei TaxID=1337664 RepID=A0ABR1XDG5_9PEZI